ncbi:oligosaccharide flippase family protein [Luteococcus sp. H138]|uniref:lipopolysaccharide biosynthesis protein n=1 Tax=unclassified Luteococcus TaxID=2639923 RepID=UPI00313B5F62
MPLDIGRFRGRPGFQAIVLAGATGFSQILMAGTFAIVARQSHPSAFGLATLGLAIAGIGVGLIDFGSNEYWLRELARDRGRTTEMFNRLGTKMLMNTVLSLVILLALLLMPGWRIWWAASLVLLGMQLEQTVQVPLRAAAHVSVVSLSMLVNRVSMLVAVLAMGLVSLDPMRLLVATSIGSLCASLFMWWRGARALVSSRGAFRPMNPWAGATRYGIISLSGSLQSLDAPLLTRLAGAAQNGLYGAVNRWTQPIALLIGAFSTASIPHVAAARTIRGGWRAIRKSSVLLLGALATALLVVVFARPVILLLLGPAYVGSVEVLRILAISTAIVIFNQPVAMILQATGHDGLVSICLPVGVLVQMLAIVLLAPAHGATGAAIAAAVAQVAMALMLAASLFLALAREDKDSRDGEEPKGSRS